MHTDPTTGHRIAYPPSPFQTSPYNLHRHGRGATPRRALLEDWHRSCRSHGRGKARALCGGHRHALYDYVTGTGEGVEPSARAERPPAIPGAVYADVLYVCPVSRAGSVVAEDLRFLIKDCHNLHGLDFLVNSLSILDLDSRALRLLVLDMASAGGAP